MCWFLVRGQRKGITNSFMFRDITLRVIAALLLQMTIGLTAYWVITPGVQFWAAAGGGFSASLFIGMLLVI